MSDMKNERSCVAAESTHLSVFGYDDSTTILAKSQVLRDDRFPWTARKIQTLRLDDLYSRIGMDAYAFRARSCSTYLEYLVNGEGDKTLRRFNACKLRLCPLCSARRAKRAAYLLTKVLDAAEAEVAGVRYIFLTLTVKDCVGSELGQTITRLVKAWSKLTRNRRFERAVLGWFRALEITAKTTGVRVDQQTGEVIPVQAYHVHIHAILAVPGTYFDPASPLYITKPEWQQRWKKSLKVDYDPIVDVRACKDKAGRRKTQAASVEAAKYTVKDAEYIAVSDPDVAAARVRDYTLGLAGRRLTAYGGVLKKLAVKLNAEDLEDGGDLVHLDDEEIREDLAEQIEVYGWNFGVRDYLLYYREAYDKDAETKYDDLVPARRRK